MDNSNSFEILAIADTHVGDGANCLPQGLFEVMKFHKPQLILHAGDLADETKVLPQLNQIARTIAVKGDNDLINLPSSQWIEVNGKTILLTHGDRSRERENPSIKVNKFFSTMGLSIRWWNGYVNDLCLPYINNMPDVIVCGHLHHAFTAKRGQTLIVNPGGVFVNGKGSQKNTFPSVAWITINTDKIIVKFVFLSNTPLHIQKPKMILPGYCIETGKISSIG